jgi:hypothetical protein
LEQPEEGKPRGKFIKKEKPKNVPKDEQDEQDEQKDEEE